MFVLLDEKWHLSLSLLSCMLACSYSMRQVISLQNLQSRQTQNKMEVLSGRLHLSLSYVLLRNRDYCPVIVLGEVLFKFV